MGKVNHIKNMPVIPAYTLYTIVFLLLAMFFAEIEQTLLFNAQQEIVFQYTETVEGFNTIKAWDSNGKEFFFNRCG